jgi:hypothetical protein
MILGVLIANIIHQLKGYDHNTIIILLPLPFKLLCQQEMHYNKAININTFMPKTLTFQW